MSTAIGLEVLRLHRDGGLIENGRWSGLISAGGLATCAIIRCGRRALQGLLALIELAVDKPTKRKPSGRTKAR